MDRVQATLLRGRSELVGRALSALRSARQHKSGSIVLVTGPAGIGKTTLLAEVRRQAAAASMRVVGSTCEPLEQVWPGAPLLSMLRTGRDPLTTPQQYEQLTRTVDQPLILADRIGTILEDIAAATPLVVAIDDLHWADRTSRFLIRTLIAYMVGLPVVWVLASRDDALAADLVGHGHTRVEHLRLPPLGASELAAIARDRLGHVPDQHTLDLLAAADGNPLMAVEILQSLVHSNIRATRQTVPGELTATLARRVGELPATARALVELVSVAGRPMALHDVTALAPELSEPAGGDTLIVAISSGVLGASDHTLAFHHDLVREAVYHTIPLDRARELHRRFADYYLNVVRDPVAAAAHAKITAVTGDSASATVLILAAEALVAIDADDAGHLAMLAFRTMQPTHNGWLEFSRRCLTVLCQAQRAGDAVAVADQILARLDDNNLAGQVECEVAQALWLGGRVEEMDARLGRVLKPGLLTSGVAAQVHAARALAATHLVAGDIAAREAAAALEGARAVNDPGALKLALRACGEAANNEARHHDALRHFRELRLLSAAPYLAEEITQLQYLDRYDHAETLLRQARADNRSETAELLPALLSTQMWQDFNLGRFDEAEVGSQTLVQLGEQLGNGVHTVQAAIIGVTIALLRADLGTAATRLDVADTLACDAQGIRQPGLTIMRGCLLAAHGEVQPALDTLRPMLTGAITCSYWPLWPCWIAQCFEIATEAADEDFLSASVQIAEITADRNPGVASFEGMALSVLGRRRKDLAQIAQSVKVLAGSPRPLLRGIGAEAYGRALLGAGDNTAGLAWLDCAWDEYHATDARGYRTAVQETMLQVGVRRDKWSALVPSESGLLDGLTAAEHRVAVLIADGHTNKSAAAELGVSVNTVGTHLRSVFTKLGVRSRVQLANLLHRAGAAGKPNP
ncbi:ATP-binding protein [Streptomyces sp. NPDC101234]|uniref:ATP-binding protein n=1 Tax=Streptomyces sp. NPDC101234 TaxID=3366138 RepID=UPI003809F5CA